MRVGVVFLLALLLTASGTNEREGTHFTPGKYLIEAVCVFSLDESVVDSHYNGSVYTMITVE